MVYFGIISRLSMFLFFFFNDPATTEIYTLSLHDALPIWPVVRNISFGRAMFGFDTAAGPSTPRLHHAQLVCEKRVDMADRKSTRLNSSHSSISYAVFCLKKKKKKKNLDNILTIKILHSSK